MWCIDHYIFLSSTIYIYYQVYIYILHTLLFFVLLDDTSWSSGYNIRPRSWNLWVGVSAGVHFLLISAAESVKTWVRKFQPLVDEVQECWTWITIKLEGVNRGEMNTSLVTTRRMSNVVARWLAPSPINENIYICLHNLSSSFDVSFYFYFLLFFLLCVFFLLSFRAKFSRLLFVFATIYTMTFHQCIYLYIWIILLFVEDTSGIYTSVFCLSSSSLFPRACCQESCIQIQADFARFYEEATQRKRANFTHPKPAVLTQCLTEVAHHFLSVSCGQTKRSTSRK